ncbi:hypothetical protein L226DRAFT_95506 [Lentinus tigrinus ALCF2SS1-7]|uniref:uncharacterized protein n=1 Tax=Lentinus tigrinus ALCF2SS1-7 TaxID=1328758 RepID=UPI001165DB9F|nr:hypothetical protein L226DRAFT_95506 [Lentinus tigrinus ALCF2SS1-7]
MSVARFGIAGGDMNELRTWPLDELRRLRAPPLGASRTCRSAVELRNEDCTDTRLAPVCGRDAGGDDAGSGKGKYDEPMLAAEWCTFWRFCSELRFTTLAGGENGLLTPERGVGGTDVSGVRNGSRRNSSALSEGGGRWRLELLPIGVVAVVMVAMADVDCCVGVGSCSDDEAAELAVEGGESPGMARRGRPQSNGSKEDRRERKSEESEGEGGLGGPITSAGLYELNCMSANRNMPGTPHPRPEGNVNARWAGDHVALARTHPGLGGMDVLSPDPSRRRFSSSTCVRTSAAATAGMRLVPGHARLQMFDHDKMDRTDTDACIIISTTNPGPDIGAHGSFDLWILAKMSEYQGRTMH